MKFVQGHLPRVLQKSNLKKIRMSLQLLFGHTLFCINEITIFAHFKVQLNPDLTNLGYDELPV